MAGAPGFEPGAYGFGDRRSTVGATPLSLMILIRTAAFAMNPSS